MYGIKKAVTH